MRSILALLILSLVAAGCVRDTASSSTVVDTSGTFHEIRYPFGPMGEPEPPPPPVPQTPRTDPPDQHSW